jgi:aspartyl-tRNA(Asn)/glutamyl-tRNA(Gln) amidotransferase subunit B
MVEAHGLKQIGDTQALEAMVAEVMADHPEAVADYRNGKKQAIGFLIGQIMRTSQGKANPKMLKDLLDSMIQ